MIGTRIQHYRIEAALGAGGMGEVYRALDERLSRPVAIKFLPPANRGDLQWQSRLRREARAASALSSPQVAAIYDLGEHEGAPFLVMELVEGTVVSQLTASGAIGLEEAVDITFQVALALEEAHEHGILHRDIKPSNLVRTPKGLIKVLDFGLAKFVSPPSDNDSTLAFPTTATTPGTLLGTIAYMSPEQAMGRPVDFRSDIFSLGVVLFELATGRLPFPGRTPTEILGSIMSRPPSEPRLGSGDAARQVERILDRCLAKESTQRFASTGLLREALGALRQETSVVSAPAASLSTFSSSPSQLLPSGGRNVLAVVPFANVTRAAEDAWIGDGIVATLTAGLGRARGLTVLGPERLATEDALSDSAAIDLGQRHGATWVALGGVQRMGPQLRLTARLVEAASGATHSTVKLDGPLEEVFRLQDELVTALMEELDLEVDPPGSARPQTPSLASFEDFSRGVGELRQASRDSLDRAIDLFERAVERDPGYALAWSSLAGAYQMKAGMLNLSTLTPKALEAGQRAVELDPELAQARLALGLALSASSEVEHAIEQLESAARLDPSSSLPHLVLCRLHVFRRGWIERGLHHLGKALRRSPDSGQPHLLQAQLLAIAGDLDGARAAGRRAVEIQDTGTTGSEDTVRVIGARLRLGYVLRLDGDLDGAIELYRRELDDAAASAHVLAERVQIEAHQKLGAALLCLGDEDAGRRHLRIAVERHQERERRGIQDPSTAYYAGAAHALLGEVEAALGCLHRSAESLGAFNRWRAARDPDLESIREQLVARDWSEDGDGVAGWTRA